MTRVIIDNMQACVKVTQAMKSLLKKAVEYSLEHENFNADSEVSILLVDNAKIQEYNREYRGKDKPTDVLYFPMIDVVDGKLEPGEADYDMEEEVLLLGDIVISMEMVKAQAEEYGHSFERELAFLVTHGMFHLLGYDHDSEEKEKTMIGKQEAVLERLGLKRTAT